VKVELRAMTEEPRRVTNAAMSSPSTIPSASIFSARDHRLHVLTRQHCVWRACRAAEWRSVPALCLRGTDGASAHTGTGRARFLAVCGPPSSELGGPRLSLIVNARASNAKPSAARSPAGARDVDAFAKFIAFDYDGRRVDADANRNTENPRLLWRCGSAIAVCTRSRSAPH